MRLLFCKLFTILKYTINLEHNDSVTDLLIMGVTFIVLSIKPWSLHMLISKLNPLGGFY